jgi:SAM-dependent methyltransferase
MAFNELSLAVSVSPREEIIGGIPYVLFDCAEALTPEEVCRLSRLSFTYALFGYREGKNGVPCQLTPLFKEPGYFLDESISSLLKYTGKTNELFTRLMLHLAVGFTAYGGPLYVLDPLAGKGTALYEALLHGHHAYGVEIDEKYTAEADQFLKRFLELARCKHTSHREKTGGQAPGGKRFTATRYQITLARDKEAQRAGDTRHWEIVCGDTRNMSHFYKKDFFHSIVADLPYGVQHASKDKNKPQGGGFTRNALGLLQEALPQWLRVLKPGGTIVLAWNLFHIPRMEMEALFSTHGLTIPAPFAALAFNHRVEQAIERDVILGVK